MAKLKVFRTPIGFHDAYVAAPSRKAALAAWGSDADLFARGVAEQVTDPQLTEEPLANPGKVIRLSRGTAAEQIAALPKAKPKRREPPAAAATRPEKPAVKRKRTPKPDRSALRRAEDALRKAEVQYDAESSELARKAAELQRKRRELETRQAKELERLERDLDTRRRDYEQALREWEG